MTARLGRPRSEAARNAVLEAALALCERDGYQKVTIKGIADQAGVGRQTVYRWWPAKTDVLLEAVRGLAGRRGVDLTPDSGDALKDIRTLLAATYELTRGPTAGALVGLLVDAQWDARLAGQLQDTLLAPRRAGAREILARGVASGQLAERLPLDLIV